MYKQPWIAEANSLYRIVIPVLFVVSVGLAFVYDTWLAAFLVGIPAVAIPLFMIQSQPFSMATRHVVAASFMIFSALHIHQMHGLVEMHFGIFVLMSFLAYYRTWQIYVTAVAVVAVHHLSFFVLQTNGVGVYVLQEGGLLFWILMVHAVYAIVQGAVLAKTAH